MNRRIKIVIFTIFFILGMFLEDINIINVKAVTEIPRIILDSYEVREGDFESGEETIISLKLKNTNAVASAENVLLTYEGKENGILPKKGTSNQIFLGNIEPSGTVEINIPIIISPDADKEYISLTCNLDYVNGTNDQREKNSFIVAFDINSLELLYDVSVANSARVGTSAFISANVINNGYNEVKDVKMIITGQIESDEEAKDLLEKRKGNTVTCDIGDISVSSSKYRDAAVVFSEAGIQTVTVSFTFTGKDGQTKLQVVGDYDVNVYEKKEDSKEKKSGKITIIWVMLLIIGLVALGFTSYMFIKRKKSGKISMAIIDKYIKSIRLRFK
ncbi:MAG: hypothetical protein K6G26_07785 [Lachnospiraceae bacterium]|nr:hypothetical protein [Lachnospiraceae bacterium]